MTSLDTIIKNVLGDSFVSAEAVEHNNAENGTDLWVDVIYDTDDDSLDAKTMMGVIAAVQNWNELAGRLPTVNFISRRDAPASAEPVRRTA